VAAGVDLGGAKIQTVVLRDGEVAGSSWVRTPRTGSPRDVSEAIVGTIRTSLTSRARRVDVTIARVSLLDQIRVSCRLVGEPRAVMTA
jgi:hypothetical protein